MVEWGEQDARLFRQEMKRAYQNLAERETPLVPAAKYFWTVRARFLLDGITRVTPWAQIRGSGFSDLVVLNRYYFGLKTPSR